MHNRKVRFWDTIDKKMLYESDADAGDRDYPVLLAIGLHGLPISVSPDSFKGTEIVGWNRDHNLIRMDSTGLKDKNGKEIYEGDVVKGKRYEAFSREHKRFIGKVVYVAPSFRINGIGQYEGLIHEELHGAYEIIGNIYEHPHLLEPNIESTESATAVKEV